MVIYQKQHRLAHGQYCVPLSESRLTRFPPPSKKAFFPSSHIFRVNSKCIIKTLFSSKCSSINFRNSLHLKRRDEKISALERATEKVTSLPGNEAAAAAAAATRERSLQGDRSAPAADHKLGSALGRPRRGLILLAPRGAERRGAPALPGTPRGRRRLGKEGCAASFPGPPILKDG